MWRLGLLLHAVSYLLWLLIAIGATMFVLDRCATFVAGGLDAIAYAAPPKGGDSNG
jgi:hypothetical protein